MNKVIEFAVLSFLVVAFMRAFHMISGQEMHPERKKLLDLEEQKN